MISFFFFWVFALVEWLTWMCHLFYAQELGVPSSVDLVCSEPAHLVASFTDGQIGLFNMETRQLVLSLESISEPGRIHMETGLSQVDRSASRNTLIKEIINWSGSKFVHIHNFMLKWNKEIQQMQVGLKSQSSTCCSVMAAVGILPFRQKGAPKPAFTITQIIFCRILLHREYRFTTINIRFFLSQSFLLHWMSVMTRLSCCLMSDGTHLLCNQALPVRSTRFSATQLCPSPSQRRRTDTSSSSTTIAGNWFTPWWLTWMLLQA